MWVLVAVAVVVAGITFVIYVWRRITAPLTPPPPPAPTGPRPAGAVEGDIRNALDDFEDVRSRITQYGSIDGPHCAEAVRLAHRVANLLREYHGLPDMTQTTYDSLKADFEALERFLDSWCTDYVEATLP